MSIKFNDSKDEGSATVIGQDTCIQPLQVAITSPQQILHSCSGL